MYPLQVRGTERGPHPSQPLKSTQGMKVEIQQDSVVLLRMDHEENNNCSYRSPGTEFLSPQLPSRDICFRNRLLHESFQQREEGPHIGLDLIYIETSG